MSLTDKLRDFSLFHRTSYLVHGDWLELIGEAERLEAQNARLRELVRAAYTESWGELSPNEYREEYWEKSAAKAALDALDKEAA